MDDNNFRNRFNRSFSSPPASPPRGDDPFVDEDYMEEGNSVTSSLHISTPFRSPSYSPFPLPPAPWNTPVHPLNVGGDTSSSTSEDEEGKDVRFRGKSMLRRSNSESSLIHPPTPTPTSLKTPQSSAPHSLHPSHLLHRRTSSYYIKKPKRSWWLIPSSSPYKIIWDMSTVLISLYSFYLTNLSITSRSHQITESSALIELWFMVDVLLNFFTEYKSGEGEVEGDGRKVVGRYLRSWFIVDLLSMIPWEVFWVQPLIDMQNSRGIFKKSFFRTKGFIKVTRVLRGRHFKLVSSISSRTRHIGYGSSKIVKSLIRYLPKYVMFLRNMKLVLPVRLLRGFHVMRKLGKDLWVKGQGVVVFVEEEDDDFDPDHPWRARASQMRRRFSRSVERVIDMRRQTRSLNELNSIKEDEGGAEVEEDEGGEMDSSINLAELILSEVRERGGEGNGDYDDYNDYDDYDDVSEGDSGSGGITRRKSLNEVQVINEDLTGLVKSINHSTRRNTVASVGSPDKVSRSVTT
ncbi:hypothetical protein TrLO_g6202 [Triparma laevis f. longispina]|uniref:Ion transport domain-containing protein n=1 Tax=Triparma laevis f. longispina TaxID=1714387 RepID=A0A9W7FRT2_9STRA|nr:hypothetical protein TrLO_g6202 [Triparma laevis f. longispina]